MLINGFQGNNVTDTHTETSKLDGTRSNSASQQNTGGRNSPDLKNRTIMSHRSHKNSTMRISDTSALSKRTTPYNSKKDFRVFESDERLANSRSFYRRSCRDIVAKCRKPSNPVDPGPIPAPLGLKGVLSRTRLASAHGGRRHL